MTRRVKRPRRVPVEKKQAAQNDLQGTANGQNCTHTYTYTRVRALNVTLPHPVGVWYRNPERVPVYNQPFGVGMHPVEGCIPVPYGVPVTSRE